MTIAVAQSVGLVACTTALVGGVRGLRRGRRSSPGATPGAARPLPGGINRVAAAYDRSRTGRRLERRLWPAQVAMAPSAWRIAQILVAIPVATLLAGLGMDPLPACTGALSLTRVGGAVGLRTLRRRADAALDAAAPMLARGLATELAAWANGGQAVTGAAARLAGEQGRPRMAQRVLQRAAARVLLGAEPTDALHRSMAEAVRRWTPASPAAVVCTVFASYRQDTICTAAALERLAGALEDQAAARREARAAVGEVRTSAVAVPLIALLTGGVLLGSDPAALAAAASPPLLPLLAIAWVGVLAAALGVRRLLST